MDNFSIVIYANRAAHQIRAAECFKRGLARHGLDSYITTPDAIRSCDLAVFWSYKWKGIITAQKSLKRDFLVLEAGYLDRLDEYGQVKHFSAGFNGLHGEAEFHVEHVPGDRAQQWISKMRPWRTTKGRYWLIIGQCPGDANLHGLDIKLWALETARKLSGLVYFRHHPLAGNGLDLPSLGGTLESDMSDAHAVITYTSNAGVDAVMAGIPTVALHPGSMAYEVASQNFNAYRPDRTRWLEKLAYCQWSYDEIETGLAWEHLRQRYV